MFIKLGNDFINTDNVVKATVVKKDSGLTVFVQMVGGVRDEFTGEDAEYLERVLNSVHYLYVQSIQKKLP